MATQHKMLKDLSGLIRKEFFPDVPGGALTFIGFVFWLGGAAGVFFTLPAMFAWLHPKAMLALVAFPSFPYRSGR